MWRLCQDCGYEIDPDLYPDFAVLEYGCPVCGSFYLDDEVVDIANNDGLTTPKETTDEKIMMGFRAYDTVEKKWIDDEWEEKHGWLLMDCNGDFVLIQDAGHEYLSNVEVDFVESINEPNDRIRFFPPNKVIDGKSK